MRCKTLSLLTALALSAVLLAGCGSADDAASDTAGSGTAAAETDEAAEDEDAAAPESGDDAAAETAAADDPYAYLADFSYSTLFDENGYVPDVTALDYVTLPEGYTALALPAGTNTVSDEDVATLIEEDVLPYFAETFEVTDRAAEMGDTVNIDYVGSVDGVEFDGGSTGGNGTTLQLTGSNYIDDFEEQIAGHTPGESFDVVVTFPDPYDNNPDLAGKEAVFKTTLNYISEEKIPELTDDFVAENLAEDTGCKTVKEVQEFFREQMLYQQESNAIYDELNASATFADELPKVMTDYFEDFALYSPWQYASLYGIGLEDMLTQGGYESVDAYLDEMQEGIEANAKQLLLIQAIAEDQGLVCDDATLEKNFAEALRGADIDDYREQYGDGYLKMMILERMAMNKLLENATFTK